MSGATPETSVRGVMKKVTAPAKKVVDTVTSSVKKVIDVLTQPITTTPPPKAIPKNAKEEEAKLLKQIAETINERNKIDNQTQLAEDALMKKTQELIDDHVKKMNTIYTAENDFNKAEDLRKQLYRSQLSLIDKKENKKDILLRRQLNYNATQRYLKHLEEEKKTKLELEKEKKTRDYLISRTKEMLRQQEKEFDDKMEAKRRNEEAAYLQLRERQKKQYIEERKKFIRDSAKREIHIRLMQQLERQKYKEQLELERKMKRLTLEETRKQMMQMRNDELKKQQAVREGIAITRMKAEEQLRNEAEKSKLLEKLKDAAMNISIQREELLKKRNIEAIQLMNEVQNAKKEIREEAKLRRNAIKFNEERRAALRTAGMRSEMNRIRLQKIRALKVILAKKLAVEQQLYKKKVAEQMRIRKLECNSKEMIKRLNHIALGYDKMSKEMWKKIREQKKQLIIRQLLQEKAEEINQKKLAISRYKLRISKLEAEEMKRMNQLNAIESSVNSKTFLSHMRKHAAIRKLHRLQRINKLQRQLRKMYEDRKRYLFAKRCVKFRKSYDLKKRAEFEQRRNKKIADMILGRIRGKHTIKCYDHINHHFHTLIKDENYRYHYKPHFKCPFGPRHIKRCIPIELP